MSQPRTQYRREYWVYPPEATEARRLEIAAKAAKASITCGPSYDDAGIGELTDKTAVLWDIPDDRHAEMMAWFATYYPGTKVQFRPIKPPTLPAPKPSGRAKLGLHASANGGAFPDRDFGEFHELQPEVIKIMTNHDLDSISRLMFQHPWISWIVRVFYKIDGREITPERFFQETDLDTARVLATLTALARAPKVVVELHNEPNLWSEGFDSAWKSALAFNDWHLRLLELYRKAQPYHKFIFPGLSPGSSVPDTRINHQAFAISCRQAIEASDGIGVHTYWAGTEMAKALSVVDWYIDQFPGKPIYVTEASNNKPWSNDEKAEQYAAFWRELQKRPAVEAVTFFVASGEYPDEVWTGNDIGRKVRSKIA